MPDGRDRAREPKRGISPRLRPGITGCRFVKLEVRAAWHWLRITERGSTLLSHRAVGGVCAVRVPGAHVDLCDLRRRGQLASFGLGGDGEGPGAELCGASGRFRINQRAVEHQAAGHVLLAGDAAHVNSVVGAQGMNIGMQDAFNLGWKLAFTCAGQATPALLDTYPTERQQAARRTVRGTAFFTRMTLLHNPALVLARRRLLPLLLARPKVRTSIEWALSQLDISYTAGARPGTSDGRSPVPSPGDRAPDVPLHSEDARPAHLFDVIRNDAYSLLLAGDPNDAAADRLPRIRRITEQHPGLIRTYRITSSAHDGDSATTALVDADAAFSRAYSVESESLVLVRPDGYLALRLGQWDPEQLGAYLRRWLIPHRMTTGESA
jgi:FAD binding domain-containing protein/aromatic ring hydroxylase-like protein